MDKLDKNLLEENVSAVAAPSLKSTPLLQIIRENIATRNQLVRFALSIGLGAAGVGCRADLPPEAPKLSFFGEGENNDAGISTDLGENYYPDSEVDASDSSTDLDLDADDSSTDSEIDANDSSTDLDLDADDSSTDSEVDANDSSTDLDLDADDSSTDSEVDSNDSSTDLDLDADDSSTDSEVDSSDSSIDSDVDSSTDSEVDSNDSSTDLDLDADDSSTDSEVDSSDSSIDSDVDSSTDSEIDSSDSSIDKPTCEGSSVGTVKTIPTKGLKGEIGICVNGSQVCVGNEKTAGWMVINSPIDPLGEELCNGKDDTCDGTTDEGITKIMPVDFDPKKVGVADCKAQIIGCVNGKEEEIQKKVGPTDEICNTKDDDCNGSTDDGLPLKEYYTGDLSKIGVGACLIGKTSCNPTTGLYEISVPEVVPTLEICSDGIDSDCNGKTDDQCDCDPDKDGIITDMIKDPNFLAALRASLKKGPNDPLTVSDAQITTIISAPSEDIQTVAGIECFQKAVEVYLQGNKLNAGVPQLEWLPALKIVDLRNNFITSIASLLYNIYFTKGAIAYIIEGNSLSISEVDDLKKKGVKVF